MTPKAPPQSDSKVTQKWLKLRSRVTFESILGHFRVGLPESVFESLLGHFNSFRVSVELGERWLDKMKYRKMKVLTVIPFVASAIPPEQERVCNKFGGDGCWFWLKDMPYITLMVTTFKSGISKPMVCQTCGLHAGQIHKNDDNHENDENDKDSLDSHKQGVECWIRGKLWNDEHHGNPGCKPRAPQTKGLQIHDQRPLNNVLAIPRQVPNAVFMP